MLNHTLQLFCSSFYLVWKLILIKSTNYFHKTLYTLFFGKILSSYYFLGNVKVVKLRFPEFRVLLLTFVEAQIIGHTRIGSIKVTTAPISLLLPPWANPVAPAENPTWSIDSLVWQFTSRTSRTLCTHFEAVFAHLPICWGAVGPTACVWRLLPTPVATDDRCVGDGDGCGVQELWPPIAGARTGSPRIAVLRGARMEIGNIHSIYWLIAFTLANENAQMPNKMANLSNSLTRPTGRMSNGKSTSEYLKC